MSIVAVIAPVFILVAAGYLAAYAGVLNNRDVEGLSRFIFNLALPVLLFHSLATVNLPAQLDWRFLGVYYLVVLVIYALGMVLSRRWFAAPIREQSIFGMGASYSNLMLVGLPIISAGLGDEALLPLFLLVSVHSAILFFITAVFIERGGGNGRSPGQIARQTMLGLSRNPIIIGLGLGFLVNWLALPLPPALDAALAITGQATLPCSLIVLGASLTTYKMAGHFAEAGLIVALKLAVQPLLVWLLLFHVFDIDSLWGAVAVMAAGMPVGVSAYIYAQNYRLGSAALSTAVLLSTILTIFSQSFWLLLLT
jgi:malonate transporter and related proteins